MKDDLFQIYDGHFQRLTQRLSEGLHQLGRHVAEVQLFQLSDIAEWGRMAAMKRGCRR